MTVTHLNEVFSKCASEKRAAFIPYVTAGYPNQAATVPQLLAMQEGGADIIELGMPFSDPLADGPTIQKSSFIALQNGITVDDCMALVVKARSQGLTTPVILMGYYNPFAQYGEQALVDAAAKATVSGFIIVDVCGAEAKSFAALCNLKDLCMIPLVAPTSTEKRLAEIAEYASGYVYCVSVTGITGARSDLPPDLKDFLDRVRKFFKIPLAVGFGLNTREHVAQVGKLAEGAVMGSIIIKTIEAAGQDVTSQCTALKNFVKSVTSD